MFKPFDNFFKSQSEKNAEIERKLELLRESPYVRQLEAERESDRVEKQKALIPKLDALLKQRQTEIPGLETAALEARKKEEELRAATQKALIVRQRTACELSLRSNWYDHQRELLNSQIYEYAPGCIAERQRKWHGLAEETRLKVDTEVRRSQPNIWGIWHKVFVPNISAVQRRVDIINAAIKSAEELKMQPLPETEIIEKLDALEKTFPPAISGNDYETETFRPPDVSEAQRSW